VHTEKSEVFIVMKIQFNDHLVGVCLIICYLKKIIKGLLPEREVYVFCNSPVLNPGFLTLKTEYKPPYGIYEDNVPYRSEQTLRVTRFSSLF
jgi:hypothetical protein